MRSIDQTPHHQRFLKIGWRLSSSAWHRKVDGVLAWTASAECDLPTNQRDKMRELVSTPLDETTLPLVVLHAYADVDAQTLWDRVFDPRAAAANIATHAVLRYSVLWQRVAVASLSHGQHQTAVVDFPEGVPGLILSLNEDEQHPDFRCVGLCHHSSMSAIATAMNDRG